MKKISTNTYTLVSINQSGTASANGRSYDASVADDGDRIVFLSEATDLTTNAAASGNMPQVYFRDIGDDTLVMVSQRAGVEGNGESSAPVISGNGQVIAFMSEATNLVTNDTNNLADVFIHVVATGTTTRITPPGVEPNGAAGSFVDVSSDGRYVAFSSSASNLVALDSNNVADVFVYDRWTGVIRRVSLVNSSTIQLFSASSSPAMSGDGRHVSFATSAVATGIIQSFVGNLPLDTNSVQDIYVYQLRAFDYFVWLPLTRK